MSFCLSRCIYAAIVSVRSEICYCLATLISVVLMDFEILLVIEIFRLKSKSAGASKKPAKKAGKDPNKPKRPASAFFVFMYGQLFFSLLA